MIESTNLEVEDDGPYQSERQLGVAVDDVFGADVDQFDLENSKNSSDEITLRSAPINPQLTSGN